MTLVTSVNEVATAPLAARSRFQVVTDRSAVLIDVRSNVGPISFGTNSITGYLEAAVHDGIILSDPIPVARLSVDMASLRSGNRLYDAELGQRLSVRRYPTCEIELRDIAGLAEPGRFNVSGEVTLHGISHEADGSVSATIEPDGNCLISGQQVFDIRDFDIPTPSVLMLRIYPDVVVHLRLELAPEP